MLPSLNVPVLTRYEYPEPEYIRLRLANGRIITEHRYLLIQHLGRELEPQEHVHHINEKKHDNRIENLEVLLSADHARHHHKPVTMLTRTCEWCELDFARESRQLHGGKGRFCSRQCSGHFNSKLSLALR